MDLLESTSRDPDEEARDKIMRLGALLAKKLGPEYLSTRQGAGGAKMTYIEGWRCINLANEVFGFNGWSSEIKELTLDFCDYNEESQRFNAAVSARVRITLSCGTFHEDVGCGKIENARSKADAIDKIKKEAITDAVKRALRNFGSLLGNCLYDKNFLENISKVKPPAKPKLDFSELHRPGQGAISAGPASKSEGNSEGQDKGKQPAAQVNRAQTNTNANQNQGRPAQANNQSNQQNARMQNGVNSTNKNNQQNQARAAAPIQNQPRQPVAGPSTLAPKPEPGNKGLAAEGSEEMFDDMNDEDMETFVVEGENVDMYDDSGFEEGPSVVQQQAKPIVNGPSSSAANKAGDGKNELQKSGGNRNANLAPQQNKSGNVANQKTGGAEQQRQQGGANRGQQQQQGNGTIRPTNQLAQQGNAQAARPPQGRPIMQPKVEGGRPVQKPQQQRAPLPDESFDLQDQNLSVGDVPFDPEERGFNAPAGEEIPSKVNFTSARGMKRNFELTRENSSEQAIPPPELGPVDRARWIQQHEAASKQQQIERNRQDAMAKRAKKEAEKLSGEPVAV